MDNLSKYFSRPYLIRYGVLFAIWIGIQIGAGISASHTLAEEKAILATLQPIAPRRLDDVSLIFPQKRAVIAPRHRAGRRLHSRRHPLPTPRVS